MARSTAVVANRGPERTRGSLTMAITIRPQSRVQHDPQNDAVRSWFDQLVEPTNKAGRSDEDVAFDTLRESAELFRWSPDLGDIRRNGVIQAEHAASVRFFQEFRGVPV